MIVSEVGRTAIGSSRSSSPLFPVVKKTTTGPVRNTDHGGGGVYERCGGGYSTRYETFHVEPNKQGVDKPEPATKQIFHAPRSSRSGSTQHG